jgi:hypothetical protein
MESTPSTLQLAEGLVGRWASLSYLVYLVYFIYPGLQLAQANGALLG